MHTSRATYTPPTHQQPAINFGPAMGMLRGAVVGAFHGAMVPTVLFVGQQFLQVAPKDATFASVNKDLLLPALVGFTIRGAISGIVEGLWAKHPKTC